MHLATIRVHDTEVLAFAYPHLDERSGAVLVRLVSLAVERGTRHVVLDLGPDTTVDFMGAQAIRTAAEQLASGGRLTVAGLNGRARAMLRSLRVTEQIHMVQWWADATPYAQAA